MNSLRRILSFLMAIMLAAIALPSVGAPKVTKQYHLEMTSNAPLTVVTHLTNVSPDGNSNISSFRVTLSGATIVSVDQPATGTATFTQTSVLVTGCRP